MTRISEYRGICAYHIEHTIRSRMKTVDRGAKTIANVYTAIVQNAFANNQLKHVITARSWCEIRYKTSTKLAARYKNVINR